MLHAFLPALAFGLVVRASLDRTFVAVPLAAAAVTLASLGAGLLLHRAVPALRALPGPVAGVLVLASCFGNVMYLGLPVITETLGERYGYVAVLYDQLALKAHGNRGKRIVHVVHAGNPEHHRAQQLLMRVHGKAGLEALKRNFPRLQICLGCAAIGNKPLADAGDNALEVFIVQTYYRQPVKRDFIDKFQKSLFYLPDASVMIQVLAVYIGHHCNGWRKFEKGAVAFISLCHQKLSGSQAGVGIGGVKPAANNNRGINAAMIEDGGNK